MKIIMIASCNISKNLLKLHRHKSNVMQTKTRWRETKLERTNLGQKIKHKRPGTSLIWGSNPMSSILSASSKTTNDILDKEVFPCCRWSMNLPGVATTIFTPARSSDLCIWLINRQNQKTNQLHVPIMCCSSTILQINITCSEMLVPPTTIAVLNKSKDRLKAFTWVDNIWWPKILSSSKLHEMICIINISYYVQLHKVMWVGLC